MKKVLIGLIAVAFTFGMAGLAEAALVSFLYEDSFAGVDGDTSGWSTNDTAVQISSSYSLLGGMATVTGKKDGTELLTHRGTRGLGVKGGEFDEVDSYGDPAERIEVTFDIGHYVNSLEVRSLFDEPNLWSPGIEEGDVDFYYNDSKFYTEHLVGSEDIRQPTKGVVSFTYPTPYLIDKLIFYVQTGQDYTSESEFAVARLDVVPIPEPATMLLLGSGLLGLAAFGRARRKKS